MASRHGCKTRRTSPARGPEPLEPRALLSASLQRGVLTVRGTAGDDVLEVRRAANDASRIEVVENGAVTFSRPARSVKSIRIDAGAGNDQALVNQGNGRITVPAVIRGGSGDDLMRGGSGPNLMDGGAGRDAWDPGGGRDRVVDGTRADKLVRAGSETAFRDYLASAARARPRFGTMLMADGGQARVMATPTAAQTAALAVNATAAAPTAGDPSAGFSQTTTQVAGVDEGDIIENDGRYLYVLSRGQLLIVDARDAAAPAVASRTAIDGWPIAEYLNGGRLTVLSTVWNTAQADAGGFMPLLRVRQAGQVQVTVYDVSDPATPTVVSSTCIDGFYDDSRMIGGRLVLVVNNDLLGGYWGGGPVIRPLMVADGVSATPPPALPTTSDGSLVGMVRRSPLARMLPTWTTTVPQAGGAARTSSGLVSKPQDVLCPATGSEANLTSILVLDTAAAQPKILGTASAIGGYTSTIHMDENDLYLFSPRWNSVSGNQTDVQRFAIGSGTPRLVSTGTFVGTLLNEYSADAAGNYLRVAATTTTFVQADGSVAPAGGTPWFGSWTMNRTNSVQVLATQGDTLAVVGAARDIAPGETIQSARFIGDRAYLCTFLQVDPLFTIDLSQPTDPKIVGELKVPGFSRLLLPFDDGYLVGLGRDADPDTGRTRGIKVSLFDVRNDTAPAEVSSFVIDQPADGWSWSNAEWDAHALGFFADAGILAVPVEGWRPGTPDPSDPNAWVPWTTQAGVVVLRIDRTGITQLGSIDHDSSLLRTARIGNVIFSVADRDLKAAAFAAGSATLTPRGSTVLQADGDPQPVT